MGICLGTQIIFESSEEDNATCLGLLPGKTVKFLGSLTDEDGRAIKIPHNGLEPRQIPQAPPCLRRCARRGRILFRALVPPRSGRSRRHHRAHRLWP